MQEAKESKKRDMQGDANASCDVGEHFGINLEYIGWVWRRNRCPGCLLLLCSCLESKKLSNSPREEGMVNTALPQYPNWDRRSDYYQSMASDTSYEYCLHELEFE